MPVLIGTVKDSELEDKQWTDKVFTGDNKKNAAALTFFARQQEMSMNNKAKGRKTTVDPQVGERLFMSTFREQ